MDEWDDFPKCPHCGTDDQDWWDGLEDEKGDGDSWVATCCSCGREYTVTMCVTAYFSTSR